MLGNKFIVFKRSIPFLIVYIEWSYVRFVLFLSPVGFHNSMVLFLASTCTYLVLGVILQQVMIDVIGNACINMAQQTW